MCDLSPEGLAEKGAETEELSKKPKKSEGLTISKQGKPHEEKQKTKSMFDLAKALNELSEDAPTEEAKVDDNVSKSQKKRNLSRKTFHPKEGDLQGSQKKQKREVGTLLQLTRMGEAVRVSFCQTGLCVLGHWEFDTRLGWSCNNNCFLADHRWSKTKP